MRNLQFTDSLGQTWKQVQKRTAEKLYNKGEILVFCPCKSYPFGGWNVGVTIDCEKYLLAEVSFEAAVNNFEYYNCVAELGNYTTFYKKA